MTAKKAVLNPNTMQFDMVDMTTDEIAEQASRANTPDPALLQFEADVQRTADREAAVAALPTAEEIAKATPTQQKEQMVKLLTVIQLLSPRRGE